jgi:hypothetical protein
MLVSGMGKNVKKPPFNEVCFELLITMKAACFLPLVLLLAGCGTPAGEDPLSQYYEAYRGPQSDWPTAPASFVTDRYGVVFYHGLPNFRYTIAGRYDRPNLPLDKLALSAETRGVNAVCLSEQSLLALHQDPETVNAFATSHYGHVTDQPGDIYLAPHTTIFAYLIKPLNPADFTPPTSSSSELMNTNISYSPRQK